MTAETTRGQGKKGYVCVQAGDEKVSDMVVFLMYRKLKRVMFGGADVPVTVAMRKKDAGGIECDCVPRA